MPDVIEQRIGIALIVAVLAAVGFMFSMGIGAGDAEAKVSCGKLGSYKVIKSDNAGVSCRKAKRLLDACGSGGKIPKPWKCAVGIETGLARVQAGNRWIKERF